MDAMSATGTRGQQHTVMISVAMVMARVERNMGLAQGGIGQWNKGVWQTKIREFTC